MEFLHDKKVLIVDYNLNNLNILTHILQFSKMRIVGLRKGK